MTSTAVPATAVPANAVPASAVSATVGLPAAVGLPHGVQPAVVAVMLTAMAGVAVMVAVGNETVAWAMREGAPAVLRSMMEPRYVVMRVDVVGRPMAEHADVAAPRMAGAMLPCVTVVGPPSSIRVIPPPGPNACVVVVAGRELRPAAGWR